MKQLTIYVMLLLIAVCSSAMGQTWMKPEITSHSPAELANSGTLVRIYNVEYGAFLGGANEWESQTSLLTNGLDYKIEWAANGKDFKLLTCSGRWAGRYVFRYNENNCYTDMRMDGLNPKGFNWTITKNDDGFYTIQSPVNDPVYGEQADYAYGDAATRFFGWNGNSNIVYGNVSCEPWLNVDEYGHPLPCGIEWAFMTVDEADAQRDAHLAELLNCATKDNPVDITEFLIENSDFSARDISGWTNTFVGDTIATYSRYWAHTYTGSVWTDPETDEEYTPNLANCIQVWAQNIDALKRNFHSFATLGDAKFYQTIYGLPVGKYKLACDAIAVQQWDSLQNPVTGVELYARACGMDRHISIATDYKVPEHFILNFIHYGGDVELGMRTESTTANHIVASNFRLMYYGDTDGEASEETLVSTDVTSFPYVVYTDNQTIREGKAFTLPIKMKNTNEDIVGFQCDIELPTCVVLEKNSRGNVKAPIFNTETDRTSSEFHTVSVATQADGAVRLLCYSAENELILGTDGTVCDFNATLAEDTAPGQYAIKMKNITMTTAQSKKYVVDEAVFVITVPACIKGDANGDESVDVADIAATANHILGNEAENFVLKAADMDDDNVIDVADIASIANLILYGNQDSVAKGQNKVAARAAAVTPTLGVASFQVESGITTASPTLNLSNPGREICGFQCDVYFPEGIGWTKNSRGKLSAPTFNAEADRTSNEYHTVSATLQEDGSVRILCYSNENEIFLGEDGAILNLPITFDGNLADGTYEVAIKNIVLTTPAASKITLPTTTFEITIGNVGVEITLADGTAYTSESNLPASKFTYTRTFNTTNWQSLYLPVAVPVSTLEEQGLKVAYINNFNQYDTDGDDVPDELKVEIFNIRGGVLLPNYPYLVRAVTTGEKKVVVENAEVMAAEEVNVSCSSMTYTYDLTGTYHSVSASELINGGCYVVSGGTLKQLAAGSTSVLVPERWYLRITPRPGVFTTLPSEVRLEMMGDGIVDGIRGFVATDCYAQDAIYDLSGRKVNKAQKGLYIQNGKKIYVK